MFFFFLCVCVFVCGWVGGYYVNVCVCGGGGAITLNLSIYLSIYLSICLSIYLSEREKQSSYNSYE